MSKNEANWRYAEEVVVEPEAIQRARQLSLELGVEAISPATGAQCALVAASSAARSIVEVGTGVGVSGSWLFRGAPGATLTTIDIEPEHSQQARSVFADAGVPASHARFIVDRAADVLPRMNENSYDIVLLDADLASVLEYAEHGLRLVRPGGTVLIPHAFANGAVSDPANRDDVAADLRALFSEISSSTAVISALSPVGDGLFQITRLAN